MNARDSNPSQSAMDGEDRGAVANEGLGESLFDDPNFFEQVVLSARSHEQGSGATEQRDTESINADRQRLLRQASQIGRQLRHRQAELDHRSAAIEAAAASLTAEQRAWRLECQQQADSQKFAEQQLAEEHEKLSARAKELAAWEAAIATEVKRSQHRVEQQQNGLDRRQQQLEQTQAELEQSQKVWALEKAEAARQLQSREQELVRRDAVLSEQQQSVERHAAHLERQAKSLQELHRRLGRFFQEQENLFAEPIEFDGVDRSESPIAATSMSSKGELPGMAATVHQHGKTLDGLIGEIQQILRATLEDRLVTSRLHAELCERRNPREIESLAEDLRQRLRQAWGVSEKSLHQFRSEVEILLGTVQQRLSELSQQEQAILGAVQSKMSQLKGTWLQIDPRHPAAGPHFRAAADSPPTANSLSSQKGRSN